MQVVVAPAHNCYAVRFVEHMLTRVDVGRYMNSPWTGHTFVPQTLNDLVLWTERGATENECENGVGDGVTVGRLKIADQGDACVHSACKNVEQVKNSKRVVYRYSDYMRGHKNV